MKTMRDSMGNDIPVKYVSAWDRERDARCRRIRARFEKVRKAMETLVTDSLADIAAMQDARGCDVAVKGNFQASSFDGLTRVGIDQSYRIQLDDRVREARDRMLAYAKGLCMKAGADAQALYEIVEEAFAATKNGGLSVGRVLSLCRRDIRAAEWLEAKRLLLDSIRPERGRAYLRCEVRPDTQRDFRPIRLDLADCWPIVTEVAE